MLAFSIHAKVAIMCVILYVTNQPSKHLISNSYAIFQVAIQG